MRTLAAVLLLTACAAAQSSAKPKLSDDYAKAALRGVISTHGGIPSHSDLDRTVVLLDEAAAQAATLAEVSSLDEINRITGAWFDDPLNKRNNVCYKALVTALRNRDGVTPMECK